MRLWTVRSCAPDNDVTMESSQQHVEELRVVEGGGAQLLDMLLRRFHGDRKSVV